MILTCSSCATRYLADPTAIGSSGRDVRCARCGHVWFQTPPRDLPMSVEDDPIILDPMAYRPAPSLPALRRPGPAWGLIAGWFALVALIGALGFGAYHYRERVVALWPASGRLYAALDIPVPGFALRDVGFVRGREAGLPLMTVSGTIVNAANRPAAVPKVRVALRDNVQRELGHQEVAADAVELAPGAQTRFTARLANPPLEARDVEVRLVVP